MAQRNHDWTRLRSRCDWPQLGHDHVVAGAEHPQRDRAVSVHDDRANVIRIIAKASANDRDHSAVTALLREEVVDVRRAGGRHDHDWSGWPELQVIAGGSAVGRGTAGADDGAALLEGGLELLQGSAGRQLDHDDDLDLQARLDGLRDRAEEAAPVAAGSVVEELARVRIRLERPEARQRHRFGLPGYDLHDLNGLYRHDGRHSFEGAGAEHPPAAAERCVVTDDDLHAAVRERHDLDRWWIGRGLRAGFGQMVGARQAKHGQQGEQGPAEYRCETTRACASVVRGRIKEGGAERAHNVLPFYVTEV